MYEKLGLLFKVGNSDWRLLTYLLFPCYASKRDRVFGPLDWTFISIIFFQISGLRHGNSPPPIRRYFTSVVLRRQEMCYWHLTFWFAARNIFLILVYQKIQLTRSCIYI